MARHSMTMLPQKIVEANRAREIALDPTIEKFAHIYKPDSSDQPILTKAVQEAVQQWMTEITCMDELEKIGLKPRLTAMFSGPPGCGKTTLAHHIAHRFGIPLAVVDLSQMISQWVGGTGQNMGEFFRACEKKADKFILLLDEFDILAGRRESVTGSGGEREKNAVVTHLLQKLDTYPGILVAATNVQDQIDPAIWRRFGVNLDIGLPGWDERWAILKRYSLPYQFDEEIITKLADATEGVTPALLRQLMEGIKRNLILADKVGWKNDIASVLERVLVATKPHEENAQAPLWQNMEGWLNTFREMEGISWPPELGK